MTSSSWNLVGQIDGVVRVTGVVKDGTALQTAPGHANGLQMLAYFKGDRNSNLKSFGFSVAAIPYDYASKFVKFVFLPANHLVAVKVAEAGSRTRAT